MVRDSEIWGHRSLLSGFHAHVHSFNALLPRGPVGLFQASSEVVETLRGHSEPKPARQQHSVYSNAPTLDTQKASVFVSG